jgi:hypothetical protein
MNKGRSGMLRNTRNADARYRYQRKDLKTWE